MTDPVRDGAPADQAAPALPGLAMVGPSGDSLKNARRIVVKVGSSLVTNEGRGIDVDAVGNWCRQLAALAGQGRELAICWRPSCNAKPAN